MKSHIEIHPAVMLILILLAVIGVDVFSQQQKKAKRASQPTPQPAEPTRKQSPFGDRPVAPPSRPPTSTEPPIVPGKFTVERDPLPKDDPLAAPKPPFGSRRPSGTSTAAHNRAQEKIAQQNQQVFQAAMNGANAYVQQRQSQPQQ